MTTPEASRRAKHSRRKGRAFEQQIARWLREHLPAGYTARRGLQCRGGGCVADVEILDAAGRQLVHLELKKGAHGSSRAALAQAERDHKPGTLYAAIIGRDRKEPVVYTPDGDEHTLEGFVAWLRLDDSIFVEGERLNYPPGPTQYTGDTVTFTGVTREVKP